MSRICCLAAFIVALALVPAGVSAQDERDDFHHLGQINKASIVMLTEAGLVPEPLGATIAAGVAQVVAEQDEPGSRRSSDYLVFEERLVAVAGRDASRLHTGRSRQDIGSTFRRLALRETLLATYESLLAPRDALLALAEQHTGTVIPGYTHGVQAQPTSLAHYLLAFAAALDRDANRLEETYARLNRSPPRRRRARHLRIPHRPRAARRAARLRRRPGELVRRQPRVDRGFQDGACIDACHLCYRRRPVQRGRAGPVPRSRAVAPARPLPDRHQQHHAAEAQPDRARAPPADREHRPRRRPDRVPHCPQHVDGHDRLSRRRTDPRDRREGT